MKHSEYVQIVKSMGTDALKKALLKGAVSNLPFLASGPMNWLAVKLTTWLAEKAAEQAEMMVFFEFIDFRTNVQAKDFEAAMISNHKAQLTGTKEEKEHAEKVLTDALAKLITLSR